jgi:hypothetical protein
MEPFHLSEIDVNEAKLKTGFDAIVPDNWETIKAYFSEGIEKGNAFRALQRMFQESQLSGNDPFNNMPSTYGGYIRPEKKVDTSKLSPLLDSKQLNERFGIPGQLTFNSPLREAVAKQRYDLKQAEILRLDTISRNKSALTGIAGLGAGLAASIIDPIGIALSFIPVVGEAKYAAWVAKYGKVPARLLVGGIEGAVGSAAIEPFIYHGNKEMQYNYSIQDSLTNIAFGAIIGSGLHAGAGAIGDAITRNRITPVAHENSLRSAVSQLVSGQEVEIRPVLKADYIANKQLAKLGIQDVLPQKRVEFIKNYAQTGYISKQDVYKLSESGVINSQQASEIAALAKDTPEVKSAKESAEVFKERFSEEKVAKELYKRTEKELIQAEKNVVAESGLPKKESIVEHQKALAKQVAKLMDEVENNPTNYAAMTELQDKKGLLEDLHNQRQQLEEAGRLYDETIEVLKRSGLPESENQRFNRELFGILPDEESIKADLSDFADNHVLKDPLEDKAFVEEVNNASISKDNQQTSKKENSHQETIDWVNNWVAKNVDEAERLAYEADLAQADNDIIQAQNIGEAIKSAVACVLTKGL